MDVDHKPPTAPSTLTNNGDLRTSTKVPMLLLAKTPHVLKPPILSLSIKSLHNLLEIIGRINNPE